MRTPLPQTGWQNVQIRAANGNELTLMTGKGISKQLRDDIELSLSDLSLSFRDVANRANRILAQNQDILADHAALLSFLHDHLKRGLVNNVYIDISENIEQWEVRAKKMYLETFQMQLRASPNDLSLDRMILLAIGPAFYVRVAEPHLFANVDMANMPNQTSGLEKSSHIPAPVQSQQQPTLPPAERSPIPAANTHPLPSPEKPGKSAQQASEAFAELEDKLSKNQGTLITIRRIRREIQSGKYDGLSIEDAQDRAAAKVWRQSRNSVRQWVEMEMKARRGERRSEVETLDEFSSRAKRKPEEPKESKSDFSFSAQDVRDFAEGLLKREGKAIGFLRQDWYDRLLKEYESMCAKN